MDVVKKLKMLRDQRQWTNYRIAQESGLSQSTIENIFKRNSLLKEEPTVFSSGLLFNILLKEL